MWIDYTTNSLAVSITQPNGIPVVVSGIAGHENFRATAEGAFTLNCTISVVDANNAVQPVSFLPLTMTIQPAAVVETTVETQPVETVVEQPVETTTETQPVEAVVEQPAETTVETQPVETVVETQPEVVQPGSISGFVLLPGGQSLTVTVTLLDAAGTVVVESPVMPNGAFSINNVLSGTYTIQADAAGHLPAVGTVTVNSGAAVAMPTVTLLAGDLNNDNLAIDQSDADLLSSVYGANASSLPSEIDLDHNGTIGLNDLNLLANNFGVVGPIFWG
jgi:hypothetical protein